MENRAIALIQLKRALTALTVAAEKLEATGTNSTIKGAANTITELTENLFDDVKKEFNYRPLVIDDTAAEEPEPLPEEEGEEATTEAFQNLLNCIFEQEEEEEIIFRDSTHEKLFSNWIEKLHIKGDPEYLAALYLLAMDGVTRKHAGEVFNFDDLCIIPDSINREWQTGTSSKTTRLIFNLYNYSIHQDISSEGEPIEGSDYSYTPAAIFASNYAPYYIQALKLRYPDYLTE